MLEKFWCVVSNAV